jgi:hypothetical protein
MAPKKNNSTKSNTVKKAAKPTKKPAVKKPSSTKKTTRKPKAEAAAPTLVVFILDKSGSMLSQRDNVVSGFNEYLQKTREELQGREVLLSLTQFDTNFTIMHDGVPLSAVPDLDRETYRPDGYTALYDAVGVTVQRADEKVRGWRVKPNILCVIMTDGQENASRTYNNVGIKELIERKQSEGWTFAFLGATADAWNVGVNLGVAASNVASFNQQRSRSVISKGLTTMTVNQTYNPGAVRSFGVYNSLDTTTLSGLQDAGINPLVTGNTPSGDNK